MTIEEKIEKLSETIELIDAIASEEGIAYNMTTNLEDLIVTLKCNYYDQKHPEKAESGE